MAQILGQYRNVDDIDNKICQLSGIVCSEIVSSTLDKKQLAIEFCLKALKGTDICGDVFPNSGMGTPSGLNSLDTFHRERVVLD